MNRPATTALIAAALILTPTAALATPGHDPVTICHKPGTPAEHEITVDRDALDKHLKHGDTVGACEVVTVPTPVPEPTPEPTPAPTTEPTPEPTEEPTWEPTAPPTETPSPEPVNPEPKPSDEPTPVQPGAPIEHGSEGSTPNSPTVTTPSPSESSTAPHVTPSSEASVSSTTTEATTPSPSEPTSTRPELAETGFNRGLLALAASMTAMGVLTVMGTRQWARRERKS